MHSTLSVPRNVWYSVVTSLLVIVGFISSDSLNVIFSCPFATGKTCLCTFRKENMQNPTDPLINSQ